MITRKFTVLLISLITVSLYFISCDRPTEPPNPNEPPDTKLSNVPIEGDTLFGLVSLYWDGGDNDGYVTKFQYRYVTHRLTIGDSIVHDWVETSEASLTIPFQSDDALNKQIFQIRAVDNAGAVDPTPAEKVFYTERTLYPTVSIVTPRNNSTYFAIEQVSDWWEGIEVAYYGYDPDISRGGGIVEYAWSVDNGPWTWTKDTAIVITPDKFAQPLAGTHTISAIAKDNTNLISIDTAKIKITLKKPTFDKNILIIDATDEANFTGGIQAATDATVDGFYSELFPNSDMWDLKTKSFPPDTVLGSYKLIIWHADAMYYTKPATAIGNYTEKLADYLNIGGKMIVGGWRILKTFDWDNWGNDSLYIFPQGSFVNEYLHIVTAQETPGPYPGDFTQGKGANSQYSDINVDKTKLPGAIYGGKLSYINLITLPGGFTDVIYSYNNDPQSSLYKYRGKAVGLRYYGTSFDAIVLGFPMYFIQKDDAKKMASDMLAHLGIN